MAYIGSPVQQVLSRPTSQSFNGDGSTTVFTLNRSVNVSEELEVFVSNVQQEPGVGKSYTANGTSLTFDEAPPSGTGNIYVIYRGLSEVTRVLEHHPNNPLAATTGTFSGNVGIGTTNPLEQLSVANSSGRASIFLASGGTNQGYISYFNSTQTLSLGNGAPTGTGVNGGQQLNILNGGNVGIGTNDPGAKLEVDRGSASFAAIFGAPQGSGKAVLFKDNHASPNRYNYLIGSQYNINNGFEITPSTAVGGTTFSNPAIAILETGKIGIGTNSPVRQLEITDGNSGKIRVSGPDGGMIECWNGTHGVYFGSGLLVTGTGNTQDSVIFVEGGGSQRYYTSGYERMRINSGGKVGIGTETNITHSLFIHDSGYQQLGLSGDTPTIWLKETDGNANENYQIRLSNGDLFFQTQNDAQSGAVNRFILDSSGFLRCVGVYNQSAADSANVVVDSTGNIYRSTSALKYKQDIRDIEEIDISQFRPIRYKSNLSRDDQTKDHFGFIADEAQDAGYTELVSYGAVNEETGIAEVEGFRYDRMTVLLTKVVQQQQETITALEARIAALENN